MNNYKIAKNVLADVKTAYDWRVCGGLCDADTWGIMYDGGAFKVYLEFSWSREAFFAWVKRPFKRPFGISGVTSAANSEEAIRVTERFIKMNF